MAGGAQQSDEPIVNINVTPLVDVTLVLLIIFMVTTKMIVSQAVPLDLPKASQGHEMQSVFSIVLAADGRTQVNGKDVPSDDAVFTMAKEQRQKDPELRCVIKADNAVTHGRVIHVLDLLKQANVAKIAFGVSPAPPLVPVKTDATGGAPKK